MRVLITCSAQDAPRAAAAAGSIRAQMGDSQVRVLGPADVAALLPKEALSLFGPGDLPRVAIPFALLDALGAGEGPVVAFAPDTRMVAALEHLARSPAAALLVPRRLAGSAPVFDEGAVRLAGREGAELARWWSERVLQDGLETPWLDQVPALGADVEVLRDAGCGVAPWNLDERPVDRMPDGTVTADGVPLRWMRLPGLHASAPDVLPGVMLADRPVLRDLVAEHAAAIAAASASSPPALAPLKLAIPSRPQVDERLHALYRRARREGAVRGPLDDATAAADFAAWLKQPDPAPEAGGASRLLFAVWRAHDRVRQAYPDLTRPSDRRGFEGWAWVYGREELGLDAALLPLKPSMPGRSSVEPPWGVNVVGYFQSELGNGETARRVVEALDEARIPSSPVQGTIMPPSRHGEDHRSVPAALAPFAVNLLCVNADGLPAYAADLGERFFAGRYSIGLWWWEVDVFPDAYRDAFDHVDEVWAGSTHVLDAILPSSPVPVVKVPHPVRVPEPQPMSRARLGLPEGFVFLFIFDYHSVFDRKNPLGAVEAFRRAFPVGEPGPSLVIKSINSGSDPANHDRMRLAVGAHPRVHLIDRYVSGRERDALLAACDAYVSLHRAEGFGQTMAEAMWLEKPVIATGYSGNLEFMDPETSWLVAWRPVPIPPGAGPYPAGATWADPDLDAAAEAMRQVVIDPAAAADRASRAARRIRRTHSPLAAGEAMRARLEAIRPRAAERAAHLDARITRPGPEAPLGRVERLALAGTGEQFGSPSRSLLVRGARRAAMKLLRPRFGYERDVAMAIHAALGDAARHAEQARLEQLALYAEILAEERRRARRRPE